MAQDTKTQDHTATHEDEPKLGEWHPLARIFGSYKDDPMLDAVMEEVYKNRRILEAEAYAAEQEGLAA